MNTAKAVCIFSNIESDKYTDEEKGTAILLVTEMPTHNGIKKDAMLNVIKYLLNLSFDITEDD